MKIVMILLLLACQGLELWGQTPPPVTEELAGKDQFQAAQWLRLAQGFWETGDYPMLEHFCRLIVEHYPNTYYAKEAGELLKKSSNPKKNRSRERRRNNPALYPK